MIPTIPVRENTATNTPKNSGPKPLPTNRGRRSPVPISQQTRQFSSTWVTQSGGSNALIEGRSLGAIVDDELADNQVPWTQDTIKLPLANCSECPLGRQPLTKLSIGAYGPQGDGNPQLILAFPSRPDAVALLTVTHLLNELKVDIQKVAFTYVVQCKLKPGSHWPHEAAVEACKNVFVALIDRDNHAELIPEVYPAPIIAMGQETLDALFGKGKYNLSSIRGASLWRKQQRIVPTWLLGTLLTQPGRYQDVLHDFENVIKYPIYEQPDDSEKSICHEIGHTVAQIETFHETVLNTTGRACLDLETSGFDAYRDKILCVSLGYGQAPYKALVVTGELAYSPEGRKALRRLFSDPEITWVFQNGKFDIRFLHAQLKTAPPIDEDTLLLHYTMDERLGTHGLKELSQQKLGVPDYERELHKHLKKKSDSYETIPPEVLFRYAALDVVYTLRLYDRLMQELQDQPSYRQLQRLYRFLIKAENVFTEVEQNGMLVDQEMARKVLADFEAKAQQLVKQLREIVGDNVPQPKAVPKVTKSGRPSTAKPKPPVEFNPNSFRHVQHYLYKVRGLPSQQLFRNHKDESTAREALDKLLALDGLHDDKFLLTLVEYRMVKKILSTYVAPLPKIVQGDGRLRSDFKLFGTVTGRLSSSKPNLMNIPRVAKNNYAEPIRKMFIAPPKRVLVYADYSQAELRVLTYYCQDPFMVDVFQSGRDLHRETTELLFGEKYTSEDRMVAKMLNFGLIYGRTAQSISTERGMPLEKAKALMDTYFARMPKVQSWLAETREEAVKNGYLTTPMGRKRRFGLITEKNLFEIRNQAANFPISSISSDICVTAAIEIHEEFKRRRKNQMVLLMVHDSILAECAEQDAEETEQLMNEIMQSAPKKVLPDCNIPFKVDSHVGLRWGDLA